MKPFLILLILLTSATSLAKDAVIELKPGHQKVITEDNITQASIGNPEIAVVDDPGSGNQVIVTAKKIGQTNLILWKASGEKIQYQIEVHNHSQSTAKEISQFLSGIEGIQISTVSNQILIEGELYRGEDLEKIQQLTQLYKNVKNYTKINAKALEVFQNAVLEKLNQSGFHQIYVTRAGDNLYLEGYARNEVEKDRALKMAQNMYFLTQSHLKLGVPSENQVWVDLQFMEVMNDKLSSVGVDWPSAMDINTNIQSNAFSAPSSQVQSNLTVTLKSLVQKGHARILSNPKLLVRDGKTATFDAGGELPIRLISERSADVIFKSYGLHIEVDAKTDDTNQVFLDIRSRISDLDLSTSIEGLPAIVEHKVNTAVDLEYGQTVALAGLIESRRSKTTKKFPFLGHIPILGELFKSRNFRNNHSEFVVFLTPYRGGSNENLHQQQKNQMDQRYHASDKQLQFSILD